MGFSRKATINDVPPFLCEFAERFSRSGYRCFLVGGAVRNIVLGKPPGDFDVATDASPEVVRTLFRRTIPTGIDHGTVTVLFRKHQIEVTTFRVDESYSDGRRPDSVSFASEIEEDLSRRDFTINAMALNLVDGSFVDPYGGTDDIRRRLIRTVGHPHHRFHEDGLRLLRALRFSAVLEFEIEGDTENALSIERERLSAVSAERIRDELEKLLGAERPGRVLRKMGETGILSIILPELDECRGEPGGGDYDLFGHLVATCEALPAKRIDLRLAGLLHDIGKVRCRSRSEDGSVHYHDHDRVGAELAERITRRLKFPNRTIEHVSHLIRLHMFGYEPGSTKDSAVRRLIARAGRESFSDLLALRRADIAGKTTARIRYPRNLDELEAHAERVLAEDHALTIRDLRINGNDLAELGIPRGPDMGIILRELLETVLDDPTQNEAQTLRTIAARIYRQRLHPGE